MEELQRFEETSAGHIYSLEGVGQDAANDGSDKPPYLGRILGPDKEKGDCSAAESVKGKAQKIADEYLLVSAPGFLLRVVSLIYGVNRIMPVGNGIRKVVRSKGGSESEKRVRADERFSYSSGNDDVGCEDHTAVII